MAPHLRNTVSESAGIWARPQSLQRSHRQGLRTALPRLQRQGCFVETILRDRADGRNGDCFIEESEIEKRSIATISPTVPLTLVDLTGDGPIKMGVPSDVAGACDQSMAQHWSIAFHGHSSQPDGVLYPSRLNEERCIALYARAAGKLTVTATARLLDCRSELAAILNDLEIALV